ncbi:hypothetical protein B0J11DRAFT_402297, partial [Dendryphion nanum]
VMGYPRLATSMASLPPATIFRRFEALNIHNILYLQSEFIGLEIKLKELEAEDNVSEKNTKGI